VSGLQTGYASGQRINRWPVTYGHSSDGRRARIAADLHGEQAQTVPLAMGAEPVVLRSFAEATGS